MNTNKLQICLGHAVIVGMHVRNVKYVVAALFFHLRMWSARLLEPPSLPQRCLQRSWLNQ